MRDRLITNACNLKALVCYAVEAGVRILRDYFA